MVVSLYHSLAMLHAASEESFRCIITLTLMYHHSPNGFSQKYQRKGCRSNVYSSQQNSMGLCCRKYEAVLADFCMYSGTV